jgi:hypothetical protein
MKETLLRAVPTILVAALVLSGCAQATDSDSESPPQAPKELSAEAGDRLLEVSWSAVDRALAYEVWYAPAPDSGEAVPDERQQYVEATSSLKVGIFGLENDTSYHIWVKAKNSGGSSDFSEAVQASPKAPAVVSTPEIQEIQPGARSLTVNWEAIPLAEGYDVYYLTGAEEPAMIAVEGGEETSLVIPDLEDDTLYYVWIGVHNEPGNSAVKTCRTYKGENAILSFKIGEREGVIKDDKTIEVLSLPNGTDLAALTPALILSPQATVSPALEASVDFSKGPVEYTVTAENGVAATYTVRVTKKAALSFSWDADSGFVDQASGVLAKDSLTLNAANLSEIITLGGSFASYEWYVDNLLKSRGNSGESEVTLTLEAQAYLPGNHRLDIFVYDAAGIPYSTGLDFSVAR